MKKKILGALLALSLAGFAHADALSGLLRVPAGGIQQVNRGFVSYGDMPGAVVSSGFIGVCLAVSCTAGDPLVGPFGTSLTAKMGVSRTATAGDVDVIGIARTTALYGVTLSVTTYGVVRCNSSMNVTPRMKMCTSATAGLLTATSSLTGSLYTGISGTPTIVTSMETRTVTGGSGSFLGFVDKR